MNTNDTQATETATTATTDESAPVSEVKSTHNKYPFATKREILAALTTDDGFVGECIGIMQARQTAHEQATLSTKDRNRQGWMSSDAVRMGRIAVKLAALEVLTDDERGVARARISHYGKQLAAHFRSEATENSPELAEQAAVFFQGK
jgi:hypothetical protein